MSITHAVVQACAVGLGGACGAVCRFGVTALTERCVPGYPVGSLAVNVLGGFAIGIVSGATASDRSTAHLLVTVGFLGGFTTFSSYSLEVNTLAARLGWAGAAAHMLLHNTLAIGAALLGLHLRR